MDIKEVMLLWFINFLIKNPPVADKSTAKSSSAMLANEVAFKSAIKQNDQLAEEFHKPIIKRF